MSAHHMHGLVPAESDQGVRYLSLELQMVVSHLVDSDSGDLILVGYISLYC